MGKPKAPPPPDYAGLAQQQAAGSKDAAIYNTNINRANQVGPEGSTTWALKPGADVNNPMAGDYTQTTQYSPEQQKLYDLNNQISQGFLQSGLGGLSRVNDVMGQKFSTDGLNPLQSGATARALPGQIDDASRQRVEQAMLSRLEPQFQQDENDLRSRLGNSGIEVGTEAYNREMNRLSQNKNDARMQAVLAGGGEESRQVGLQTGIQGQEFGQALQNANLGNAVRGQGIQEEAYMRQLPINEINALRTGSQVQAPQFGSYYTGGQAQGPQTLDAGIAQGNYQLAANQQAQSGYNALLGGLGGLGNAGIMKYSDVRLKKNIRTIGRHPSGVRRVAWDWKFRPGGSTGVIAQELQVIRPDAVGSRNGLLTVNYDLIGGH